MAQYPQEGKVKTRLAAEIGSHRARSIYQKLLQYAADMMAGLNKDDFLRAVFVHPPEMHDKFKSLFPQFDIYYPLEGEEPGVRLKNALRRLLSEPRIEKAILIGTDSPGIDAGTIQRCADLLDESDLVLGPTYDGGYYLLGCKAVFEQIFAGIEWHGSDVFEKTIQTARKQGLKVDLLPELHDLDDLEDLEYFESFLSDLE